MGLTTAQKNTLNSISPAAIAAGALLGNLIDQLLTAVASGQFAITADAGDIDSVAKDGGNFSLDPDSMGGLILAWKPSYIFNGSVLIRAQASGAVDHLTLSASNTNYVEVNRAGVVSANVSGFTAGSRPIWTITAGSSTISTIVSAKSFLDVVYNGGWPGAQLSAAQATKYAHAAFDTSVSVDCRILSPNAAWVLTGVWLLPDGAVSASDSTYFTLTGQNKSSDGTGTTALLDTNNANTTKATGGSAIAADVRRGFVLNTNPANLAGNAHDALKFSLTKSSTPADFKGKIVCEFSVAG